MNVDKELWEQFRNGNELVFKEIYNSYSDMLYGYGMKIVQDEAVVTECIQSLFIYMYEKRQTISFPQNMTSYLLASLRRSLYKMQKKNSLYVSLDSEDMDQQTVFKAMVDMKESLENTELNEEQLNTLQSALETLSPQQKEVVYLRYYKGLSVDEVAETIGVKHQTVKNVACMALARLRENKELSKIFYIE